ncbi:MAG: hypothetical protein Q7N50_05475, partial [Armatimonadota bacterium]|nr:hypothetical protein [Armatimonadota bacterium]
LANLNRAITSTESDMGRIKITSKIEAFNITEDPTTQTTESVSPQISYTSQSSKNGVTWTYTFRPANLKEYPELPGFAGTYRSTFKMRLLFPEKVPDLAAFRAYTDSTWERLSARIDWNGTEIQDWNCKLDIFNGHIARIESANRLKIDFYYAKPVAVNSFDETVVTLRGKEHSFSFAAKDLAQGKRIFIRDYGVLVTKADDATTYTDMEKAYAEAPKDVYRRVTDMPEQTLGHAWSDMPEKNRIIMNLCVEGGRQYFRLQPNGDIMHNRKWLDRIPSTDTPRADWPGGAMFVRFGIPEDQLSGASREEGYLPIAISWWEKNGLRLTQTAFATTLSGKLPPGGRVPAEEPQVAMVKFTAANSSDKPQTLRLPIRVDLQNIGDENLIEKDGMIFSRKSDKNRLRLYINTNGVAKLIPEEKVVTCEVAVLARETREFYVSIPFLTHDSPAEIEKLRKLNYDAQHKMIADFWRNRTAQGTQITTPEPMLNAFYKANPSHQLINTMNQVGTDKRYIANVGTGSYGIFPNESIMMITELDRRGYHDVAEKALEMLIHYQGTRELPGDFSSKEGVYFGANGYEEGGYNQHQGWVLWGLAEHYWFTRDNAWLDRVAPSLIKGCDWIINERNRTKTGECVGIRAIEYGLLPQGKLEDISDWRCWLSTNAFSFWGLENVARALAERGHPDGQRLLKEAEDYKKDILKAYTEAMVRSPVVGLRDGTFVPYIPSDVHRRGRSFGWITETLEGAIHLIRCGVIYPDDQMAIWTMRDYEDNRYISEQYGYQTPYFERDWFSIGGFSQQPSLLCSPTPYLMGDEIKHYLRAYFNAFASGYFPERAMLTEHPLPNLGNWSGGHFKTSDEAMNTSWLRWMFVWDEGKDLYLGKAIPRYWLNDGKEVKIERAETHFGQMNMSMKSYADKGRIEMTINPPTRNLPGAVYARFRHPEGKSMNRVTVNGKPYGNFDPAKEWVILPPLKERTVVVAYYD